MATRRTGDLAPAIDRFERLDLAATVGFTLEPMNISTLARAPASPPPGSAGTRRPASAATPARADGYRPYTESDLSCLKLILTLRRLGLGPA